MSAYNTESKTSFSFELPSDLQRSSTAKYAAENAKSAADTPLSSSSTSISRTPLSLFEGPNKNMSLTAEKLVYPIFLDYAPNSFTEVPNFPQQYRIGINKLVSFLQPIVENGLRSVMLFGMCATKDELGSEADNADSVVIAAVKLLKETFPLLIVICDVCLCAYTLSGHCGILKDSNSECRTLDSIRSAARISKIALSYALAGCDIVSPSDSSLGHVAEIRLALESRGFSGRVVIMPCTAKFASHLYNPFRYAVNSKPFLHGGVRHYQVPISSRSLAMKNILNDVDEGAEIIVVKPASLYLDVCYEARNTVSNVPIAVFQVSGEYVMIYEGCRNGSLNLKDVVMESMDCYIRAGASIIISYFTPKILQWLVEKS